MSKRVNSSDFYKVQTFLWKNASKLNRFFQQTGTVQYKKFTI